jgi:hypothetical protein
MDNYAAYQPLLWISALLFFATAGYLIANLGAVMALFGHRGPQHGDLQADTHGRRRQARRGAVIAALALHVAAIVGLAIGVFGATLETAGTAPQRQGFPAEMEPVPDG